MVLADLDAGELEVEQPGEGPLIESLHLLDALVLEEFELHVVSSSFSLDREALELLPEIAVIKGLEQLVASLVLPMLPGFANGDGETVWALHEALPAVGEVLELAVEPATFLTQLELLEPLQHHGVAFALEDFVLGFGSL